MNPQQLGTALSAIVTEWEKIHAAQTSQLATAGPARFELAARYQAAVRRFLLCSVLCRLRESPGRADQIAEDLASDVMHELLAGGRVIRKVKPINGKSFRHYLKRALRRRVLDRLRLLDRHQQRQLQEGWDGEVPERLTEAHAGDEPLGQCLRAELLQRALQNLAADASETGQASYALVRLRLEHLGEPLPPALLAQQLTAVLGKPFTESYVNVLAYRGRKRFGELLVREVQQALQTSADVPVSADAIADELIDLGLFLPGVRKALEDYRKEHAPPIPKPSS